MITLEVVVADDSTVELVASKDPERRSVRTLPELAAFVSDDAAHLSSGQLELLGRLAAVLATFDPAAVMARDATSIGKIIDSHYFNFGTQEQSRAFGQGEWEAARHLRRLSHRPDAAEVKQILQVA